MTSADAPTAMSGDHKKDREKLQWDPLSSSASSSRSLDLPVKFKDVDLREYVVLLSFA